MDDVEFRREQLRHGMRDIFEQTVEERVDRYLSVGHQQMIGAHHFAQASTECIEVYRDGYFLSALMVSHAVAEGIWKFVLERNAIRRDADLPGMIPDVVSGGIISQACAEAFVRIHVSFRNDVHHMNPGVAKVDAKALAYRNLKDLATIEREIFGVTTLDGKLRPNQPKYWDVNQDGAVPVYFRLG